MSKCMFMDVLLLNTRLCVCLCDWLCCMCIVIVNCEWVQWSNLSVCVCVHVYNGLIGRSCTCRRGVSPAPTVLKYRAILILCFLTRTLVLDCPYVASYLRMCLVTFYPFCRWISFNWWTSKIPPVRNELFCHSNHYPLCVYSQRHMRLVTYELAFCAVIN